MSQNLNDLEFKCKICLFFYKMMKKTFKTKLVYFNLKKII